MEACPFCGGQIDEQVVLYGGTCPACFAHIPGEEAATDPGEDVKQAQEAEDRRRAKRRALVPLLIAAPVLLAIVGVSAWLALRPEPELALLDLDGGEFYTPDLDSLVVAQPTAEDPTLADEAGDADADAGKVATTSRAAGDPGRKVALSRKPTDDAQMMRKPKLGQGTPDDAELLASLGSGGDIEDVARKVRDGGDIDAPKELTTDLSLKSTSTGMGGAIEVDMGTVSQSGAPLSNGMQIARMIQGVMRKQLPRLRSCYESSLRANPDLAGSWVLTFTVETDGSVRQAGAKGLNQSEDLFEECLSKRIRGWHFQRIVKPQPVKKTVDFTR